MNEQFLNNKNNYNRQHPHQTSTSSTFKQSFTPMSRLDQLLDKNEKIYQNLKAKLNDIAQSNKKIDRNIHNMQPLYDYIQSARSKQDYYMNTSGNFNKNLKNNYLNNNDKSISFQNDSLVQSNDYMKRKLQIMQQIQRQSRIRANYNISHSNTNELQLVQQLQSQEMLQNNLNNNRNDLSNRRFANQQVIINDKIDFLQSSRPIEKRQYTQSSRISQLNSYTPMQNSNLNNSRNNIQVLQSSSSNFLQVPINDNLKHKTNKVYMGNIKMNNYEKQNTNEKDKMLYYLHKNHSQNFQKSLNLQQSSQIADQRIGYLNHQSNHNDTINNSLSNRSKERQQQITFNMRTQKSSSFNQNQNQEQDQYKYYFNHQKIKRGSQKSIQKRSKSKQKNDKSHIMIQQNQYHSRQTPSNTNNYSQSSTTKFTNNRKQKSEKSFQKISYSPLRHSIIKNSKINSSQKKVNADNNNAIRKIVIHSNQKYHSIQSSFRSGQKSVNLQPLQKKQMKISHICLCKSHSRIKYKEKSYNIDNKILEQSHLRKVDNSYSPKINSYLYIPFNKLYISPILQLKNPTTLILARKTKTSLNQTSSTGRIIDGSTFKYKKGVVFTQEVQLIHKIMNQNAVESFQFQEQNLQSLEVIKQGKSISVGFIGGKDTLKKKLHVQILNEVYLDIQNQISSYINLPFTNNYTSKITILIQHRQILSFIQDPHTISEEFIFNVPLNQEDKQYCSCTLEQLRKCLQNISNDIRKTDEDIVSSYKFLNIGQKQKKIGKRLRITKLSSILEWGVNLQKSRQSVIQRNQQQNLQSINQSMVSQYNSKYSSPQRITKDKVLYNLEVISTNRFDLQFIKCLEVQKLVWCINPLIKSYDITRQTLNVMKQYTNKNLIRNQNQKQNRSSSRKRF